MAKKKETEMTVVKIPTDLDKDELKGAVKEIMLTTYKGHQVGSTIVLGKIETEGSGHSSNYIKTFDENGHKTKHQSFSPNGYKIHLYNDKGLEFENTEWRKGKLENTTITTHNEAGSTLESISRATDGTLQYRSVHTYNPEGRELTNIMYLGEDETVIHRVERGYDEKGNYVSCMIYGADDVLSVRSYWKYNEQNKEIEQSWEPFGEGQEKNNYRSYKKYNAKGDCIESASYNMDGSLRYISTYTPEYDKEGNLIVPPYEPYNPDPLAKGETEVFENDSHGNWTKNTRMYNTFPVSIKVREISYYDDEIVNQPPFIHAITTAPPEKMEEKKQKYDVEEDDGDGDGKPNSSSKDEAKWIVDGAQATAENFQQLRYYAVKFKEAPSVVNYQGPYIEPFALYEELMENMHAKEIYSYCTVQMGRSERVARYTLSFPQEGYLVTANSIGGQSKYDFEIPGSISKHVHDYVYTCQIQLLRPSIASGKRDDFLESQLTRYIDYCTYTKKPDQPTINMIEVNQQGFVMEEHDVDDSFEIRDLDINYGYGFTKFHKELMGRFNKSSKGLVLFHGLPGTGKTYYIRHLLREMANSKKEVIYMPPNMVDHLTDPVFMTFLSSEIREWSSEGKFCVLLIEDAEPLLAKRQEGVRIQGVTNLLNMTDGLLNDMLNLQIICTFNVDLKKLDSALLRPGRLIARKEFKALNELDANLLAQRLGIKHHFKKPATLGEIYSFGKDMSTLIHDVEAERDASTSIDDL